MNAPISDAFVGFLTEVVRQRGFSLDTARECRDAAFWLVGEEECLPDEALGFYNIKTSDPHICGEGEATRERPSLVDLDRVREQVDRRNGNI